MFNGYTRSDDVRFGVCCHAKIALFVDALVAIPWYHSRLNKRIKQRVGRNAEGRKHEKKTQRFSEANKVA